MLHIFLSSMIIFPVLIGFGSLSQRFLGKVWKGVSALLVAGILTLMVFWHVLAFFMPLDVYVEGVSVGVGWTLFFYFGAYRNLKALKFQEWKLWAILSCGMFSISGNYPFIMDHFGYYVPNIKWLSEFGLVKGISNLDWVLGQMSPWHIFQAGFSHFSDVYLRMNALLLSVFFLYIIERKVWLMFCFTPILFFFIHSPSSDLPSIIFSMIILNEVLKMNEQHYWLFAFSVLVFSIKPTMIWLPILCFFYPMMNKRYFRWNFAGLVIFVGMLYVAKNLWVFGYPFFPVDFFDFGFSWKPNSDLFEVSKDYGKLMAFGLEYSMEEIKNFTLSEYVLNWLFLTGFKGVVNLLYILCLLIFGVYVFLNGKNKIYVLVFVSVLVKSILVLCFSAQYRFFLEVFFVVFFLMVGRILSKKYVLGGFFYFSDGGERRFIFSQNFVSASTEF